MPVLMGIDVGQRREPTAICAVESKMRGPKWDQEEHYLVRYLERMPVGTSYPEAAKQTARIAKESEPRGGSMSYVFLDATGLGKPIVDLFAKHIQNASVTAVFFTHGDRRHQIDRYEVTLGKAYLVARLQTLLQTSRLHLPRTTEAEQLAKDLLDYEIRVETDANDRYGAFKVGARDDLVTALGLAVHYEPPGPGIWVPRRTHKPIRVAVPLLGGPMRLLS